MKLTASNPAEQRRQLMLLGLLVVVALVVWYTQSGGAATEATIPASNPPITSTPIAAPANAQGGRAGGGMPEPVRLASLEQVPEQGSAARNPFGFGTPPPPPPRPAPAYVAPTPTPTPPPRPVLPPPLPPIPVKFIGFVEDPARPGKVVALAVNGGVVIAREGELIDGRYRLVKVGQESIVMAYPDGRGQQTFRMSGS